MGLYEELRDEGSKLLTRRGKGQGEPDSSFQPRGARQTSDWPTLILEVGWSQSLPSLRQTMRWWFDASQHAVKIVILMKIRAETNSIMIEKWVEQLLPQPTHMARSFANRLAPTRAQEITISSSINFTPMRPPQNNDFQVISDPLIIDFNLLFLRAPAQDTNEGDLLLTAQHLRQIAVKVFEEVAGA